MGYTITMGDAATPGGGYTITPAQVSDPTDGMSGFDTFMAGLGKSAVGSYTAIKELVADMAAKGIPLPGTGGMTPDQWAQIAQQLRSQVDEQNRLDAPLMSTKGGIAGNIAGQVAQAFALPAGGATGLARLGTAALAGGIQGGALTPLGTDDSRTAKVALDAGLSSAGQGVANIIGAVARPVVAADAGRQGAVDFAASQGIPLSRGQMSGNPFTLKVENMLANLPMSQGFYKKLGTAQQQKVDDIITRLTGGDPGAAIQQWGGGKDFTFDQQFFDQLRDVLATAQAQKGFIPNSVVSQIKSYLGGGAGVPTATFRGQPLPQSVVDTLARQGKLGDSAQPGIFTVGDTIPMTGPRGDMMNYWGRQSAYGKLANNAEASGPEAVGFQGIQSAYDEAAMRSLENQGVDPGAIQDLKAGYSIYKLLQPASTTVNDTTTYSLPKAVNILTKDANQGRLDRLGDAGDTLKNLAAFGKAIAPVKSSGTAENQLAGGVATGAIVSRAVEDGPEAAAGLLKLYGIPWLVNAAMQSTRNGVPLLRSVPDSVGTTLGRLARSLPPALLGFAGTP
jgi:hypothetical protein